MQESKLKGPLTPGDIIQLDPDSELGKMYGPQFLVVEDVRSWGVSGYFTHVEEKGKFGQAPLRVPNGSYERVGRAAWVATVSYDVARSRN